MVEEVATPVASVDSDLIAKQLHRILASKTFRQADRIKRFLGFIVKETVEGRAEKLKEFSVGVEVFGRDSSFDPRFDPIVRVQARRLRSQLEKYYAEEAGPDELILEVPKGRYAVIFKSAKVNKVAPPKKTVTPPVDQSQHGPGAAIRRSQPARRSEVFLRGARPGDDQ